MDFEECRLYKAIDEVPAHKVSAHVMDLIDPGREVRLTDSQGRTLLHHVCLRTEKFREVKALPVVYQLSTAGCDVNLQDNHGNTCLHLAVQGENVGPLVAALFRYIIACVSLFPPSRACQSQTDIVTFLTRCACKH